MFRARSTRIFRQRFGYGLEADLYSAVLRPKPVGYRGPAVLTFVLGDDYILAFPFF